MKLIRNRADGRWAPARFNFALFRLPVFIIAGRMQPREGDGVVLAVDRHQNRAESYAVSIWLVVVSALYFDAALAAEIGPWAAGAVALPLALVVVQFVIVGSALSWRAVSKRYDDDNTTITAGWTMTVFLAAAMFAARSDSWVRWVALSVIAVFAANAAAAAVLWIVRGRVSEVNRLRGAPE